MIDASPKSEPTYRNQDGWYPSGNLADEENVKALIAQCQRDLLEHNFGAAHRQFLTTVAATLDWQLELIAALERERDEARGQILERAAKEYEQK